MKWFKHISDSHNDPDLNVAWDKFGDKAVILFWITLELYAKEFDKNSADKDGFIPITNWFHFQNQTRMKRKSIQNVLVFFASKNRILLKPDKDYVFIKIPKFIELADNYTRLRKYRKAQNDNKSIVISDNKMITSKEEEEDKEIYKESRVITRSPFLKRQDVFFEGLWKRYPKRLGKKEAKRHFRGSVKTAKDYYSCKEALKNYIKHIRINGQETKFVKHGSTWFNNWQDWVDYKEPIIKKGSNIA